MKPYQKEFGKNYPLDIIIPDNFEDQSYRNDTGPTFVYQKGYRFLKICILPKSANERDLDSMRYTLIEVKTQPDDDYQEFVKVHFESESPAEFEQLVNNPQKLQKLTKF